MNRMLARRRFAEDRCELAQMGLESSDRETPTASYAELQAFRAKAVEMGLPSLATAALIGWEWLQRETDIFGSFDVTHYRPKDRPNAVRVVHFKTREENWVPLFDDNGVPLYPELMAELDAIKRERCCAAIGERARLGQHGRRRKRSISRTCRARPKRSSAPPPCAMN
jgi:hypothetical protein